MSKRFFVLCVAALFTAAASGYSQMIHTGPSGVKTAVVPTDPTSGKQMYASYCASCHGMDGKGHGPVAPALKAAPTDLTTLAQKNSGKYPEAHIVSVLKFGSTLNAHGTTEMPIWGPMLGKPGQNHAQEEQMRISNLSRYLKTLQVR